MIGMFARSIQKKEMKTFTQSLCAQDGRDIAASLIVATAYRNNLRNINAIDLFQPAIEFQKNPKILINLGLAIRQKQSLEEYELAAALMIWLHTIRSMTHPTLRNLGRELWGQLSRGMAHVPPMMDEGLVPAFLQEKYPTLLLDMQGYNQYPLGLTPEPLQ
ncbi:hypothetical protein NFA99_004632 [Escherichia coli]|nr:hypothetical protein [Escherichia coli]